MSDTEYSLILKERLSKVLDKPFFFTVADLIGYGSKYNSMKYWEERFVENTLNHSSQYFAGVA